MRFFSVLLMPLLFLPVKVLAESLTFVDRENGDVFGPFDTDDNSSVTIAGREYFLAGADEPKSINTHEDTLYNYLMAAGWPERIKNVVKSEGVIDRMRVYYTAKPILKPDGVSVVLTNEIYNDDVNATILIGTREFNRNGVLTSTSTSYVLRKVADDWLVDWDETTNLFEKEAADDAQASIEDLGLADASIEMETLALRKSSNYTRIEVSLKNNSSVEISRISLSLSLYDQSGAYISQGNMHISGVKPGESVFEIGVSQTSFRIAESVKCQIALVDIYRADGTVVDRVERYFSISAD